MYDQASTIFFNSKKGSGLSLSYNIAKLPVPISFPAICTFKIITQTIQILDPTTRYITSKDYAAKQVPFRDDSRGNVREQTDALLRKTTLDYDGLNRLTKTTDPLLGTTQSTYDVRNNLITVTDALQSQTKYEYDRANRMTKEIRPLNEATTYAYDPASNLTRRTNAKGEARTYGYDDASRRVAEQHFAAGVTPTASNGTATNAARSITYGYDERALLTSYTDTGDTNLGPQGISATANSGTYSYDDKGQKLTETITVQIGGTQATAITTSKTITTAYHPNGLKASVTYPALAGSAGAGSPNAGTTAYTYDTNNQLKKLTTPANQTIDITAYQWTSPTQKVIPGAVTTMSYDALLRPTSMKSQALGSGTAAAPTGAIIHDTRPSYNAVSNITKRDTDHGSYTYAYDDLDRLTQVTPPTTIPGTSASGGAASPITLPVEGYQYDAVHNRKTSLHQTGSAANAWLYNAHHQLTQWGDPTATASSSLASITTPKVTQTYDQNGHLITKTVTPQDLSGAGISKGLQSHINLYNAAERLVKVSDGSNNEIASYAYNPFGQRIKKTISQNPGNTPGVALGTTIYFYADEGLIAEADASGNITTSYGWNPNGMWGTAPVWKRDFVTATTTANATEHYYHLDHLGTPQRLTNAAGEVSWRGYSEAFGKVTIDVSLQPTITAVTVNNLRFPGQVEDEETGTHYNNMRDYQLGTGRYVETDPAGVDGGINTYAYVGSSPQSFADPEGKFPINVVGALGAAAFNFSVQAYLNYQRNGGDVRKALQCVDLGNVAASAAVGFFLPGGFTALQKGRKFLRGGSGMRFGASVALAAAYSAPMATGLGQIIPPVPLNRIVPTLGTDCSC